jgi:hypothetical protein
LKNLLGKASGTATGQSDEFYVLGQGGVNETH